MVMMTTETIIIERAVTHGDFESNARISQCIKAVFHSANSWQGMSSVHKEALDMIALKISRILSGRPDHRDHWDDVAGYAKLAADRCGPTKL